MPETDWPLHAFEVIFECEFRLSPVAVVVAAAVAAAAVAAAAVAAVRSRVRCTQHTQQHSNHTVGLGYASLWDLFMSYLISSACTLPAHVWGVLAHTLFRIPKTASTSHDTREDEKTSEKGVEGEVRRRMGVVAAV